LARDDEAASIWAKHLPADHILNGNKHDNFWEMGDTGPCGPCSEIHIDLRSDEERAQVSGASLVNHDHPQVIEIWNLVFMQFNRKADGSLEPLPARVIDTGMGFERLCMALQGKTSNYDTDVFTPLIGKIASLSGKTYGKEHNVDVAMRVIADHVRTIAFSIADNQLPSNAKAGYVIRRILRRAVRYAYTFLEQKQAFMYRLIDTLIESMGEAYPELPANRELIMRVIKEEEDAFLRTLENGIRILDDAVKSAKAEGKNEISGKQAFTLYDTYGFPLDLTELILKDYGMSVDQKEFDAEMAAQKARARNAAAVETSDWVIVNDGEQQFVGYDCTDIDAYILRYRKVSQKNKEYYQIIFDRTPFYGEMGGQVGDRGVMKYLDGETIDIFDAKRENGVTVHLTRELPEDNDIRHSAARLIVDKEARQATSCNHTATHLLHQALREVLGEHVEQRGSYVSPDVLRFDFSHFQKVTPEELRKVERLANKRVRMAMALDEHRNVPIAEAREMGAMALFGEKYGDEVRVIRYGDSVELCGGTHVANTGNIGMIRILSEGSVAAGIRRIEAITGAAVEELLDRIENKVKDIAGLFNNAPDLVATIRKSIEENAELHRQTEEYLKERINNSARELLGKARTTASGIKLCVVTGPNVPDLVKGLAFAVRNLSPENTAFVAATSDVAGKPLLTAMITDDIVKSHNLSAAQLVRDAAKNIKGGGGGQPGFAQAGGKDAQGLEKALEAMLKTIAE
ncbi:MAG: alanine--tRNA ligase, partial [Muribaculaceae bacterium]|nr:alanine--tRNA ligase [Muribaculaceae bacterium]